MRGLKHFFTFGPGFGLSVLAAFILLLFILAIIADI